MLFFLNQGQVEKSEVQTPPSWATHGPRTESREAWGPQGLWAASARLTTSCHPTLSCFTLCPNPAASRLLSPSLHPSRGPSACRGPDLQGGPCSPGMPTGGATVHPANPGVQGEGGREEGCGVGGGGRKRPGQKGPPTQEAGPRAQGPRLWSGPESLRLCERPDARRCSATVYPARGRPHWVPRPRTQEFSVPTVTASAW